MQEVRVSCMLTLLCGEPSQHCLQAPHAHLGGQGSVAAALGPAPASPSTPLSSVLGDLWKGLQAKAGLL